MEKRFSRFSVPLGLLDYINPILYSITMVTITRKLFSVMGHPGNIIFLIGAIISVFFGLIKFRMPVSLVFSVNTGILISGLMLLNFVMDLQPVLLALLILGIVAVLVLMYKRSRKVNTIAVLTGAAGYLLLYISLITLSIRKPAALPIIMYAIAILLFVMLCGIGIKANLKNPKVHWVIEISNVLCQFLVAAATILLFV